MLSAALDLLVAPAKMLFVTLPSLLLALKLPTAFNGIGASLTRRSALAVVAASPLALSAGTAQADTGASVFVGTYTDPMHPGGTRTIFLQNTKLGPYQLARIVGAGGEGEPAKFELPAMIAPVPGKSDAWQITIDFSPKGGPKDFTGYWDADGIRFPPTPRQIERGNTAGNKWPKAS